MGLLFFHQSFNRFAQFKTKNPLSPNYVFLYPLSSMAISPQNNEKTVFYTGKLYGLTGMIPKESDQKGLWKHFFSHIICQMWSCHCFSLHEIETVKYIYIYHKKVVRRGYGKKSSHIYIIIITYT